MVMVAATTAVAAVAAALSSWVSASMEANASMGAEEAAAGPGAEEQAAVVVQLVTANMAGGGS